jgi:hypothetical protein
MEEAELFLKFPYVMFFIEHGQDRYLDVPVHAPSLIHQSLLYLATPLIYLIKPSCLHLATFFHMPCQNTVQNALQIVADFPLT